MNTEPGIRQRRCGIRRALGMLLALASLGPQCAVGVTPDRAPAPLVVAQAGGVAADEAAAIVRGAVGGRILDVRLETRRATPAWRVKVLLPGGRVRVYLVDADSGRIL